MKHERIVKYILECAIVVFVFYMIFSFLTISLSPTVIENILGIGLFVLVIVLLIGLICRNDTTEK